MDMKQRLEEYGKEVTRWEKVTYRPDKKDPSKKKAGRGRKSGLYVNTTVLRAMLESQSQSAQKIAYMVMDECDFETHLFNSTYAEIGQTLKMSKASVERGMVELLSVDFMRKVRNGKWILNPAVGTKCYAEDIEKLFDKYASYKPYIPKTERSDPNNDIP